jgi:hypothetical protein
MAQRTKRRVKQRAKAHQVGVKARRKVKKHARSRVGFGAKKRRAKKARTAGKKK